MKKKSKKKEEKKWPYYWFCHPCATKKGGIWPEGHVATMCRGQCKYCGKQGQLLAPYVDYNWPNEDFSAMRD